MALDRTVSVKLKADIAGYVASLKQAGAQTASFAKGIEQGAIKNKAHLDKLGTGLLAVGVIAGLGVAAAVSQFAEFDQAMSSVEAATHETAAGMELLRDAAIDAGARTVFSAKEAAGAQEALAKAGVSTADILGGALNGALDLAAAGTLGVADAAEIAATAMTQFGLEGSDVPHIADLLAAAAGKAQGEVSDMGVALKYVGPVAHQMGVTLEETAGTIALLASNGILADQAGTSMRGMLSSLTSPSAAAADTMKDLGINVYDAQGNFVGFEGVAGQMNQTMKGLTKETRDAAFGQIFGNAQITSARILYAGGADAVADWTDKVNDAGYAQETAAIKLNNLKGDMERLKGSISSLLIETGEASDGFLRGATQQMDAFIGLLGDAPGPLKNTALALGVATAAVGLLGGGAIKAMQGVVSLRATLAALTWTARGTAIAVGTVGALLTAGIGAVALWANEHAKAKQRVDDLTQSIVADGNAIGEQTRALVVNRLEQDGVLKAAQSLGISMDTVTDAFLGSSSAIAELRTHTTDSVASFSGMTQEVARFNPLLSETEKNATLLVGALGDQTGALADARTAADRQKQALEGSAEATGNATTATRGAVGPMNDLAGATGDLNKELKLLRGENISTAEAVFDFRDGLVDLTESVKDNGTALAGTTSGGRANHRVLIDLIEKANAYAEAVYKQTGSVELANAGFNRNISTLREVAVQTGLSKAKVDRLIAAYARLPAAKSTKITASGVETARELVARLNRELRNLPRDVQTTIRTIRVEERNTRYKTTGQAPGKWATGGRYISGPGSGTSDSILAELSNGEFVSTAAATAANLPLLEAMNRQGIANGATTTRSPAHYATGGQVTAPAAGPSITYGNVTVANIDELMRKQETKLRDITTMAGLRVGV